MYFTLQSLIHVSYSRETLQQVICYFISIVTKICYPSAMLIAQARDVLIPLSNVCLK